jgi:hypothetical protein
VACANNAGAGFGAVDGLAIGVGFGEAFGSGAVSVVVTTVDGPTATSAFAIDTPVTAIPAAITIVVMAAMILFMTNSWVREIYVGLRRGAPHDRLFTLRRCRGGGAADVGGVSSAG